MVSIVKIVVRVNRAYFLNDLVYLVATTSRAASLIVDPFADQSGTQLNLRLVSILLLL